ncbi:MAG: hypothetical protein WCC45_13330, partial [Paeniglutamicibacter sp.]
LPDAPEHGQGVGLPLVRRLARTRGGEVWIADPGGPGNAENAHSGAVFAARLPGVLSTENGTTEGKNAR